MPFIIFGEARRTTIGDRCLMEPVRVKVLVNPRLLGDLIAAALTTARLRPWRPGDPPAQVTVTSVDLSQSADTPITVVLPEQLDEPLAVRTERGWQWVRPTRPHELHDLLIALAHRHDSPVARLGGAGSSSS